MYKFILGLIALIVGYFSCFTVLYLLDNLDARLDMMKTSIDQTKEGQFGPRVYALENRMIYRKKEKE